MAEKTTKPRKRRTLEQRLADAQAEEARAKEAADKKVKQAKARTQKAKALVNAQKRKQDTRRKIIAGAIALEHMEHDEAFAAEFSKLLKKHVTRPEDRELLDL